MITAHQNQIEQLRESFKRRVADVDKWPEKVRLNVLVYTSSSSPFPTRWGQRPEFLIPRMFCPGHPLG